MSVTDRESGKAHQWENYQPPTYIGAPNFITLNSSESRQMETISTSIKTSIT